MFSHGTCTFEILSSYQFSPLLLHVSKDEKFCFWIPDVLKENFCLKFSWCLILLSWHLCPMLVVGWNFLMDLFHFRLFSENLLKYLAYSVSPPLPPPQWCVICESFVLKNEITQYRLNFFRLFQTHLNTGSKTCLFHKPDFYAACCRFLCRWERRMLGTNGAGPLTDCSHGWLIQIISLHLL